MQTFATAANSGKSAGPKSLIAALTQPASSTCMAENPSDSPKNADFASIFSETVSKSMSASLEETAATKTETSQNSDLAAALLASLTQNTDLAPAIQPVETANSDLAASLLASYQAMDNQTTVTTCAVTTSSQQVTTTDIAPIEAATTSTNVINQAAEQNAASGQGKTVQNTVPVASESAPEAQSVPATTNESDQILPEQAQSPSDQATVAKTQSAVVNPLPTETSVPANVAQEVKNEVIPVKTVKSKDTKAQVQGEGDEAAAERTGSEQVKSTYHKSQTPHTTQVTTHTSQSGQTGINKESQVKAAGSSEISGENAANLTYDVMSAATKAAPASQTTKTTTVAGINAASLESQVSTAVASSLNRVGQSVTITLNPPELGRMTIRFEQDGGELVGRVEFEKAAVGEQLGSSLPKVIQNLQESGVGVREIELIYKGNDQNQGSMADNSQPNNSSNANSESQRQYSNSEEPDVAEQPVSYGLESEQTYSGEAAVNVLV